MVFFKKKIKPGEAPDILEHIIRIIIDASGQSMKDFIKTFFEKLNLPAIPIELPVQSNLKNNIVKTLMKSINNEQALIALKKIKKILDNYKI